MLATGGDCANCSSWMEFAVCIDEFSSPNPLTPQGHPRKFIHLLVAFVGLCQGDVYEMN